MDHNIKLKGGEFVYSCAIIDSRGDKIASHVISNHRDRELSIRVLESAIKERGNITGVILTSDNAAIYKSKLLKDICTNNDIIQSFIKPGKSTQNRPIEYFFSIFKNHYLIDLPKTKRTLEKLKEISID